MNSAEQRSNNDAWIMWSNIEKKWKNWEKSQMSTRKKTMKISLNAGQMK